MTHEQTAGNTEVPIMRTFLIAATLFAAVAAPVAYAATIGSGEAIHISDTDAPHVVTCPDGYYPVLRLRPTFNLEKSYRLSCQRVLLPPTI